MPPTPMKNLSAFHLQFRARLKAVNLNQTQFGKLVGQSPPMMSRILTGDVGFPLDQLDRWADALGLEGTARDEFLDCVSLSTCPLRIQALVKRLQSEDVRLREVEEKCKRRMSRIRSALGDEPDL